MQIAIKDIIIPKDRLREFKGRDKNNSAHRAFTSLVASIKKDGLINAITVAHEDGKTVLVAGRHRIEAHADLGLSTIEAVYMTGEDEDDELRTYDRRMVEIEENLSRVELTSLEFSMHMAERAEVDVKRQTRRLQIAAEKRKAETAEAAKAIKDKTSDEYKKARAEADKANKAAVRVDVSASAGLQNVYDGQQELSPPKFPKKAIGAAVRAVAEEAGVSKRTVERAREAVHTIGTGTARQITGTNLDQPEEIKALVKLPVAKRMEVIAAVKGGKSVSAKLELDVIERDRKATDKEGKVNTALGAYQEVASQLAKAYAAVNAAYGASSAAGNPNMTKRIKAAAKELDALATMARQGVSTLKS